MITIENKTFKMKDGSAMKDTEQKEIDTLKMLEAILMGSQYENSSQVLRAGRILDKIATKDNKINLEDNDFNFIKEWMSKYTPVVSQGTLFLEFVRQFEIETQKVGSLSELSE